MTRPTFAQCLCTGMLLVTLVGCQPSAKEWYARGVSAVDRGAWAEAAEAFANAGNFADAHERAAEALALVNDAQTQYEAAQLAIDEHRWAEAYAALERVLALDPNHAQAKADLARVTAKLDELYAQAREAIEADDPAKAAEIYAALGDYRDAPTRAEEAATLARELASRYERMTRAAEQEDWATALTDHQALMAEAPGYADVARLRDRYLRRAYRAAKTALEEGHSMKALAILNAIVASDPSYRDTAALLAQARSGAIHELLGVHMFQRAVGEYRGWALQLDSVEVRPEGDLMVRVTLTNKTSLSNHLTCLQNRPDHDPTLYLVAADGRQITPRQWACQQWGADEWDLGGGESMAFWFLYPAQYDLSAPFTLVFAPWGQVKVSLMAR